MVLEALLLADNGLYLLCPRGREARRSHRTVRFRGYAASRKMIYGSWSGRDCEHHLNTGLFFILLEKSSLLIQKKGAAVLVSISNRIHLRSHKMFSQIMVTIFLSPLLAVPVVTFPSDGFFLLHGCATAQLGPCLCS